MYTLYENTYTDNLLQKLNTNAHVEKSNQTKHTIGH